MNMRWMLLGLGLGLGLSGAGAARADVPLPPVSNAAPTAESIVAAPTQVELTLDLTCTLPTNGPAVERGRLVARLHEYDPRTADGAAREIGRVEVAGVTHRPDAETVLRFPCAGVVPVRKAYYLTAVLYPDDAATDGAGGLYYLVGFRRVLAAGNRESLAVTLVPVGGEGEPTN
ncbi:MAG TPA: hypothetical protein PK388_08035 [Kiritimatiellia bacterium]|nr:hypothetical protein [Kiritimatiellia bacterium]